MVAIRHSSGHAKKRFTGDEVRAARVLVADATEENLLRRKDGGFPGTYQDLGQLARKRCEVLLAGRNKVGM